LECAGCGLGMFDGPMPNEVGNAICESTRFRFVKRLILKSEFGYLRRRKPMRLLEIGSGSGELASLLHDFGHEVTCCDVTQEGLDYIARMYGLRTIYGTIQDANLEGLRFDGIVMRHVLEHIEDPDSVFAKLKSHLAPDGRIFLSQPNYASWCRLITGKEWGWTLPWHRSFWTEDTLRVFLEHQGFRVIKSKSIFSHLGLPLGLPRIVAPGAVRKLLAPLLIPIGTLLELAAVVWHRAQNLFVEAALLTRHDVPAPDGDGK